MIYVHTNKLHAHLQAMNPHVSQKNCQLSKHAVDVCRNADFLSRSDASSATKWEVHKATRNESSAGSEGSTKS